MKISFFVAVAVAFVSAVLAQDDTCFDPEKVKKAIETCVSKQKERPPPPPPGQNDGRGSGESGSHEKDGKVSGESYGKKHHHDHPRGPKDGGPRGPPPKARCEMDVKTGVEDPHLPLDTTTMKTRLGGVLLEGKQNGINTAVDDCAEQVSSTSNHRDQMRAYADCFSSKLVEACGKGLPTPPLRVRPTRTPSGGD